MHMKFFRLCLLCPWTEFFLLSFNFNFVKGSIRCISKIFYMLSNVKLGDLLKDTNVTF